MCKTLHLFSSLFTFILISSTHIFSSVHFQISNLTEIKKSISENDEFQVTEKVKRGIAAAKTVRQGTR